MQINVGQLLREHIGTSRSYAVSDIIRKDDAFFHNMEGTINLLRTKRGILVNAHIKAEIEDQCIRCLRTINIPVLIEFEEEVFPQSLGDNENGEVDYENYLIDNNNQLYLNDLLSQYIELNRPVKPLCKDDCPGIQIT